MVPALKQIELEDDSETIGEENVTTPGYGFTMVIMNKHTGEIIRTIKYRQVLITLEERAKLEENVFI